MNLLKRIFSILLLLTILIVATLFTLTILYGDKVCFLIINEINKNIKSEISVKSAELDLFHHFPDATINFHNVIIKSAKDFNYLQKKDSNSCHFVCVKELSVNFNLFSIFSDKYIVNGLIIKNGYINILYNEKNKENFKFWDDSSKGAVSLNFKKVTLNDIDLFYSRDKTSFKTHINEFNVNGFYKKNQLNAKLQVILQNSFLKNDTRAYHIQDKIQLKLALEGDSNKYILNWAKLQLLNNTVELDGHLQAISPYNFEINISCKNFNIATIPLSEFVELPNNIQLKNSKLYFSGKATGTIKYPELLNFSVHSSISNFDIVFFHYNFEFDAGKIDFNYKKDKSDLNLQELNMKFKSSSLKISTLYNFKSNAFNKLKLVINLNFNDLNNNQITKGLNFKSGYLKTSVLLDTISELYNFRKKTFDFSQLKVSSEIDQLCFSYISKDLYYNNIKSNFDLHKNNVSITTLNGDLNSTAFSFIGKVKNVNHAIDTCKKFDIQGVLNVRKIDLEKILKLNNDSSGSQLKIKANLTVQCDTFSYNKLLAYKAVGKVTFSNNLYLFNQVKANLCKGELSNGSMQITNDSNQLKLVTNFEVKNIDLPILFNSFENFGQTELTSKNIQGKLTSKVDGAFYFDANGNLISNKTLINANFSIINGELNNFSPIFALSKFIELEELKKIKFSKISNKITLNNNLISIPLMDINSSVSNLSVSGMHTLDNVYEYHIKVKLSDFLFRKASRNKNENTEFGKLEKDTLEKTSIFIKLTGKGTDYKYAYDTNQAMKSFSERAKKEKLQLKEIFKEEFGFYKKDSSVSKTEKKKQTKVEIKYTDEIKDQKTLPAPASEKKKSEKHAIDWKDE